MNKQGPISVFHMSHGCLKTLLSVLYTGVAGQYDLWPKRRVDRLKTLALVVRNNIKF